MKINKVAQLCKKDKMAMLFDHPDSDGRVSQWIGDGNAMYPIYSLPYLDTDSVFTIFDVPEKQRDGWYFKHIPMPEGYCIDDTTSDEYKVDYQGISVSFAGRLLKPLRTQHGLVFIESKYLAPLADVLDVLELYERKTSDGQTYIAAKAGFLLLALIMPHDVINREFVQRLTALTRQ